MRPPVFILACTITILRKKNWKHSIHFITFYLSKVQRLRLARAQHIDRTLKEACARGSSKLVRNARRALYLEALLASRAPSYGYLSENDVSCDYIQCEIC